MNYSLNGPEFAGCATPLSPSSHRSQPLLLSASLPSSAGHSFLCPTSHPLCRLLGSARALGRWAHIPPPSSRPSGLAQPLVSMETRTLAAPAPKSTSQPPPSPRRPPNRRPSRWSPAPGSDLRDSWDARLLGAQGASVSQTDKMVLRLPPLKSPSVGPGRGVGIYFNKLILMIHDPASLGKELTPNLEFGPLGIVTTSTGPALGLCGSKVLLLRRC